MQNTVSQQLAAMASVGDEAALRPIVNAVADRLSSQAFNAGTLAIATVTQNVKLTSLVKLVAGGVYVALAAADPIYTLVAANSVSANKHNVMCLYCNAAGTVSARMGTEAATVGAVKFPTPPEGSAMIGFLMISAGASVFTGGTTALTGGTVTVVYTDVIGASDPSIIL